MLGVPRRYSDFVFGVIQSGLTSLIAAGIASSPAIRAFSLRLTPEERNSLAGERA